MVKIVTFNGGLGNQMFLFAFCHALRRRSILSLVEMDIENTYGQHNGFELFRLFKAIEYKGGIYYRRVKNLIVKYQTKYLFKEITEDTVLRRPISGVYPFMVYNGFWQSEHYFKAYETDIRRLFTFDTTSLNPRSAALAPELRQDNTVSLHIRRGDYTEHPEFRNICTTDYYRAAVEVINQQVTNARFYVFTNDATWVRQHINFVPYQLIDWNMQVDSWQDMYLMTQCRHNIIANSSFSWWGAWLNNNCHKVVVAPQRWFNTLPAEHTVPTGWQCL